MTRSVRRSRRSDPERRSVVRPLNELDGSYLRSVSGRSILRPRRSPPRLSSSLLVAPRVSAYTENSVSSNGALHRLPAIQQVQITASGSDPREVSRSMGRQVANVREVLSWFGWERGVVPTATIDTQRRAVCPQTMAYLPTSSWEASSSRRCAVCHYEYTHGDLLRRLPCFHDFHRGCIDPWLSHHTTCPCCRTDVEAAMEEMEQMVKRSPPRVRRFSLFGPEDDEFPSTPEVSFCSMAGLVSAISTAATSLRQACMLGDSSFYDS